MFRHSAISTLSKLSAPTDYDNDPLLDQLRQMTKGLWYMSESDYPLEPVSLPISCDLIPQKLLVK